jgi:hypothetical protein
MCAGLQQMRGKGMAQRMDGCRREVKLLAGDDDEALQGTVRHGRLCRSHPFCQSLGRLVAASHIGKQPARISVKAPILPQILQHKRRPAPLCVSVLSRRDFVLFSPAVWLECLSSVRLPKFTRKSRFVYLTDENDSDEILTDRSFTHAREPIPPGL